MIEEFALNYNEFTEPKLLIPQKEELWYAARLRSNYENIAYNCLVGKSIETFLPRIQRMSRKRNSRKKILAPLFPGYLFVKSDLTPSEHLEIVKSPGIVRLLGINGKPIPINSEEISNLMIMDGTDHDVQQISYLNKGDKVIILDGPFKDLTGIFLKKKNKTDRIVVSVEFLQRSVSVEVADWAIEKVA